MGVFARRVLLLLLALGLTSEMALAQTSPVAPAAPQQPPTTPEAEQPPPPPPPEPDPTNPSGAWAPTAPEPAPAPTDASVVVVPTDPPPAELPASIGGERPPDHEHRGFFVRGLPGGGYLELSSDAGRAKGLALGIGVQVGFAVIENLIIFGHFWYRGASSANGDELMPPPPGGSVVLNAIGGGPGVAWYFMPPNLHVALSFDFLYAEMAQEATVVTGLAGYGGHLTFGKEWWVLRQLGIGIAADAVVGGLDDGYILFGAGLNGTITFN